MADEYIRRVVARERAKAQWDLRLKTDALRRELGQKTKAQQDAEALRKAWEGLKAGILKLGMPWSVHSKMVAAAQRLEADAQRHTAGLRS